VNGQRRVVDVAALPNDAFGHQGLIWWGTVGFMVIEGSMFVMGIVVYFYLRLKVQEWPPSLPNPELRYGTMNLMLVLLSLVPNQLAKSAAEKMKLGPARFWLAVLVLMGIASVVLRGFEYTVLGGLWNDNAYASIVWVLLSMHTLHVATDVVDSGVLLAIAFVEPMTKKRFIDLAENSLYWYFIVGWWIPVYATIYLAPRWL
jgi:cytochrome c oxidase subunit III